MTGSDQSSLYRDTRPQTVTIEGHVVGTGRPCFIIAEIGVNHNGNIELAHQMVDAVAEAKADCVKFQTFQAAEFCNDRSQSFEYISKGTPVRESMFDMFSRLELPHDAHQELFAHARQRGLVPLSTPSNPSALDLLASLNVGAYKVGSDDLVFSSFLDLVARKAKPMIISTGMADADDVLRAVKVINSAGNLELVLLHCVSGYPTADAEVNLQKIEGLRALTGYPVGFSDHSFGITAALGAVALGACIVEKHFTLDRNMAGPDHRFSSDPAELCHLVDEVRRLETQLGSSTIIPTPSEIEMRLLARRSVVASRELPADAIISAADLAYRRPGTGLLPYESHRLVGRKLREGVAAGHIFKIEDVE